ncbi:MAG: ATP-dependent acyl-CoA ligase [Candidatus Dadabacteria bacterium]|nr:ATP-dependent acyl-CoA ligase [Candidatus Dadabacteria bacterium]MYA48362.1 ATP-dependent acyl-CoA ligase [Candidatus Dadabacteria bacterium]MYF47669.1 ATP-dependent acyl-CoA ligase [Candidatus Dadabacteria bacterium]MYG83602.1 ATP-dependent acyl-CoA ligase [Candidatus Dadabacteria bacterium]MYK49241.1 ATP-dependent acyl-CoA ligase [Candidatus Dadabacteria bacterium]
MQLLFKPREAAYLGSGDLPFGRFEDTSQWEPITRNLEKGAEAFPEKAMFKVGDRDGNIVESYTYAETNAWANKVANGLAQGFGINKGDKVGMYMLNCSEHVISIIAIHKCGGVQVPVNKDEKGERLAYVINYSDMRALIIDEGSISFIEEIGDSLEHLEVIFVTVDSPPEEIGGIKALPFSEFDKYDDTNPGVDVTTADMERCMFTSGTTGMPKGVARDHGGVIMTVRSYLQQQGVRSDDVLMSILSLGHANAQVMCLFSAMASGATAVFFPRFSASNFWKWAGGCGATCINMLGAVAEYLWAAPESEWDQKHNVRIMLGSPAPRNLKEFQERFGVRVIDGYGSTEMGMVLWKDPEDHRPGSSGFPMEGYYVELRDPEDIDTVVRPFWDSTDDITPPDEAKGLLFVKPLVPHTTLNEYFKDERRTREAFDDDGFFNSDDLFARGIDGRYYFVGRFSRIRVSGENVDPVAVGDEAMLYPAIQEAIAVGIRLPNVSDDEVKLCVTLKAGEEFDPVEFSKWMAERVIVAMVPRFIEVYEEGFPVTATQKVKVAEIKEITDNTWDRNETGLKFSARK